MTATREMTWEQLNKAIDRAEANAEYREAERLLADWTDEHPDDPMFSKCWACGAVAPLVNGALCAPCKVENDAALAVQHGGAR